jgi:hypothetical protein
MERLHRPNHSRLRPRSDPREGAPFRHPREPARVRERRVLWLPPKKRGTEEKSNALRATLGKTFIVVSADAFKQSVESLEVRIGLVNRPPPLARTTRLSGFLHDHRPNQ